MRQTYEFHLRGGSVVTIKADNVKVTYSTETGGVKEWKADNAQRWFWIDPSQIAAIVRVR